LINGAPAPELDRFEFDVEVDVAGVGDGAVVAVLDDVTGSIVTFFVVDDVAVPVVTSCVLDDVAGSVVTSFVADDVAGSVVISFVVLQETQIHKQIEQRMDFFAF
jgi:hypothetical protein